MMNFGRSGIVMQYRVISVLTMLGKSKFGKRRIRSLSYVVQLYRGTIIS
jgi:hypothetical protein